MMIYIGSLIFFVIAWFCGSVALAYLQSLYEIKTAPREPMFICKVHGPIRKENTIIFSNYEGVEIDPITQKSVIKRGDMEFCTLCFHNRLTEVENIPYGPDMVNGASSR